MQPTRLPHATSSKTLLPRLALALAGMRLSPLPSHLPWQTGEASPGTGVETRAAPLPGCHAEGAGFSRPCLTEDRRAWLSGSRCRSPEGGKGVALA